MLTHGSLARSYCPPLHFVNGAWLTAQVWPPSNVAAASRPTDPPLDQRSCCQTPTRCIGLVGSIAANGSTSASRVRFAPTKVEPAQPWNGEVPETVTSPGIDVSGGGPAS